MIQRIQSAAQGRCDAVSHGGLVYAVSYDASAASGIVAQTRNTLEMLDRILAEAGSGKTALLQATVYLYDMSMKSDMDAVWCEWIGPAENWPQRACVGANMDVNGETLIELVVTAVQF